PKKPLPVASLHCPFDSQRATVSQTEAVKIPAGRVPSKSRTALIGRFGCGGPTGAAETGIAAAFEVARELRARASEPGTRPSAVEMSEDATRIAPAVGAERRLQPTPAGAAAARSRACCQRWRYAVGSTAPS